MRQKITIGLFLLVILTPLLINTMDWADKEKIPSLEHSLSERATSVAGKLLGAYRDVVVFVDQLNQYYENDLSLRDKTLPAYFYIKEDVFKTNAFPEKVVKGSDGWLFLGSTWSNIVAEAKGLSQFNKKDLAQITENIEQRNKRLASTGITYIPAIAPEKLSVYGQYLSIEKSQRPTKLEQLKASLNSRSVPLVDMSQFFDVYRSTQLYLKTDTHWNDFGAYLGYMAVIEEIKKTFPAVEPLPLEKMSQETQLGGPYDLMVMLTRNDLEEHLVFVVIDPQAVAVKEKRLSRPENTYTDRTDYEERYINPSKALKVLVFRDSFSSATMKFFAENFGEIVFVFSGFDQKVVELEKPDVIIHEVIERDIDNWVKD